MAEVTYVDVTWTTGDFITEAKLDNMVANDRAVDAHNQGLELVERADPSTPGANKLHIYAKDKDGVPALYVINDAGTIFELSENRITFEVAILGTLVTGTNQTPIVGVTRALTIIKAYVWAKTAPTGQAAVFDFNKNSSSIWGDVQADMLTLAASATYGTEDAFATTALAEGDALTFDTVQVGTTNAGADATLGLRCKP